MAGLNRRIHLCDLAFADQVTDRRRADHDLVRRNTSTADALHQGLRNDCAQRFRQHRADHFFFGRWEDVHDTVDGLGCGRRVERTEHQVSCFGGGERKADRFQVAHFADQHDVGVFAQCRT